ncbi:MAG: PilZ domain-containing protein [Candidatus Zixiibacteriota bacterium]
MSSTKQVDLLDESGIDSSRFDFSLLVGRPLTLFSQQFPGKPLMSRVVLANDREVVIDRSGGMGLIDSLVNNQKVILRIEYKGQQVAVPALLKRSAGGTCKMILGEKVLPLKRRRFVRVAMVRPVKLAVLPLINFEPKKLTRLRWTETVTINISPGGALIDFSSCLERSTYLLINMALEESFFPSLVLGQVRYTLTEEIGHFQVGVEFIVREMGHQRFSSLMLERLPPVVLEYSESKRNELNNRLKEQIGISADT